MRERELDVNKGGCPKKVDMVDKGGEHLLHKGTET